MKVTTKEKIKKIRVEIEKEQVQQTSKKSFLEQKLKKMSI